MSVVFNLNNPKEVKSAIRCVVRHKNIIFRCQVGISVQTKFWDANKSRAKATNSYRDAVTINYKLDNWKGAIDRVIFNSTIKNIDISDEADFWSYVKCEISNEPYVQSSKKSQSFTNYIETVFIPRFDGKKSVSRIRRFKAILTILTDYEKEKGVTLTFQDIDVPFYRDFREYCYDVRKYTVNYFGNIVKVVKQFMKEAVEIDKLTNNSHYKTGEFKAPTAQADTEYLTVTELEKIHRIDVNALIDAYYPLSANSSREQLYATFVTVKNLFITGAFTGLRVSDFTDIKNYNFRDNKMTKITQKDRDHVVIPIHPIVQEIIDSGFDYTRKISEKTLREYIKILCRFAGLTEEVEIRTTRGGVVQTEVHPRYELISTHTCRRSFATNAVIAGVPIAHIMMITGHSRESDFWRYVRVRPSQIADMVADSKFFKGELAPAVTDTPDEP